MSFYTCFTRVSKRFRDNGHPTSTIKEAQERDQNWKLLRRACLTQLDFDQLELHHNRGGSSSALPRRKFAACQLSMVAELAEFSFWLHLVLREHLVEPELHHLDSLGTSLDEHDEAKRHPTT